MTFGELTLYFKEVLPKLDAAWKMEYKDTVVESMDAREYSFIHSKTKYTRKLVIVKYKSVLVMDSTKGKPIVSETELGKGICSSEFFNFLYNSVESQVRWVLSKSRDFNDELKSKCEAITGIAHKFSINPEKLPVVCKLFRGKEKGIQVASIMIDTHLRVTVTCKGSDGVHPFQTILKGNDDSEAQRIAKNICNVAGRTQLNRMVVRGEEEVDAKTYEGYLFEYKNQFYWAEGKAKACVAKILSLIMNKFDIHKPMTSDMMKECEKESKQGKLTFKKNEYFFDDGNKEEMIPLEKLMFCD